MGFLPWGWSLWDCIESTARFIMSGLMGVAKTVGSVVFAVGLPSRLKIFAVFFGGMVLHRLFSLG